MRTAILISIDGTAREVTAKNGRAISYEEIRDYVGGSIDMVPLPDGRELYVNDNGKLDGLPKNEKATEIWVKQFPISEYPLNNDALIVGDVLITKLRRKKAF